MSITLREGNKSPKKIEGKEEILPKGTNTPKVLEPAENKIVDKPQEISYNDSNKESGYVGFEDAKPKSQNSKSLNGMSFLEASKNDSFLENRYKFGPQFNEWLKKNHDAIKYSGDNTFNNIKNTMENDVPRFMQDAPFNVDKNGLISSLVKWNLADKAGNKDLKDKAVKNTIGYMSEENQEEYLKDQQPLADYIRASDDNDNKVGRFTTTRYSTTEPDEDVRRIQRELNELGYKNKYGNPLTEDGLVGSNTLFAVDTYWGNTKPKRRNSLTSNNKYKTAIIDGKEYKVEYPLATLEDLKPKMLTNEELKSLYSNYDAQLISNKNNNSGFNAKEERLGEGIWSLKNDDFGVQILSHWLYGNGKELNIKNPEWQTYMTNNETLTAKVKEIVMPLADNLKKNQSKNIDLKTSMVIENGEDIIGYQYLHGTNADVGGFQIKGTVSKNNKGDIIYDLTYTWNDKIDPNFIYESDSKKAEFAKSIPFANPTDYIIRISWKDKTVIKANPSWFNWSYGWLK